MQLKINNKFTRTYDHGIAQQGGKQSQMHDGKTWRKTATYLQMQHKSIVHFSVTASAKVIAQQSLALVLHDSVDKNSDLIHAHEPIFLTWFKKLHQVQKWTKLSIVLHVSDLKLFFTVTLHSGIYVQLTLNNIAQTDYKTSSVVSYLTPFWATVCKMVRPLLSDRCLSVCLSSVCDVGVLWPNSWVD